MPPEKVGTNTFGTGIALSTTPAQLDVDGRLIISTSVAPSVAGIDVPKGQAAPTLSQGAVAAYSAAGVGLWAQGNPAGSFQGNVTVTGTITAGDVVLPNADCAEEFNVSPVAAPGDVMVLDPASVNGSLRPCEAAYDRRVAGIVSGAGPFRPGIVLDRQSVAGRRPIALVGKVFCKVDAQYGAVGLGDLLTTSPTPGHAMTAADPARAFGAVLGKALAPLAAGRGLIPVLVALQ
jgi:hypothetical protein